jgi:hypothetical protein
MDEHTDVLRVAFDGQMPHAVRASDWLFGTISARLAVSERRG